MLNILDMRTKRGTVSKAFDTSTAPRRVLGAGLRALRFSNTDWLSEESRVEVE